MKHLLLLLFILLTALPTSARTYMVSVGICRYQYIRALRQTENDARAMAELYRSRSAEVTLLLGAEATHDAVLRTIRTAFAKAGPDDTVVLFFSGHGSEGGLCAYDTRRAAFSLTYAEMARVLKDCRAGSKQLFIDACFSGGLRIGSNRNTPSARTALGETEGVMLFLSSRSDETSQEPPYGQNGQFTKYLLRGLKGGADASRNSIVEAREIFDFVSAKVAQATRGRQHPVMWGRFADTMHVMNWNPRRM